MSAALAPRMEGIAFWPTSEMNADTWRLSSTYTDAEVWTLQNLSSLWRTANKFLGRRDRLGKYPTCAVRVAIWFKIVVAWSLTADTSRSIPPNLRFRIPRDFESPWFLGDECWDLIHLRMSYGSVSSWKDMYLNVYQYAFMREQL